MSPDDVTAAFAVLATLGAVLGCAILVALAVPSARHRLLPYVAGQGPAYGWLVATVATLGSLYLSEVANFPPCRLCWFQRIAMYPLVVLLGVAALRRDTLLRVDGLVLAGLGLLVNLWHVAVEIRPSLEGTSCDPANPCSTRWVEQFGFWTIPRMATVAFSLVIIALLLPRTPIEETALT